jgi:hypothetical protein
VANTAKQIRANPMRMPKNTAMASWRR